MANNRAIKAPSRSPGGGSIRSGKTMLEDDFMVDYPAPPTVVDFYEEQQEDVRKRDVNFNLFGYVRQKQDVKDTSMGCSVWQP